MKKIAAKFKLDKVSDIPLMIRQRMYKEIMELLPEVDEYIEKEGPACGVASEEWPVSYMFNKDTVIVIMQILKADMKEMEGAFTFSLPRNEVDKLLEEVIK
jgi:hypothetical protein